MRKQSNKLEIYTLGTFVVKQGNQMLSEDSGRSQRLWGLFKYLLTQRSKSVPPEELMETLWAEEEHERSDSAVKTLVYRLRRTLNGESPNNSESQYINFSQGGYTWNNQSDYWLDSEVFENYCLRARKASGDEEKEECFRRALDLYKGDYLPEYAYNEWVVPVSNYYRRLYLESVLSLIDLLKKQKRYGEISAVCEKAFTIDYFDEDLHRHYLESLLEEGKTRHAQAHYESITAALYRELGAKPSPALRGLYRRIKNKDGGVELDLNLIQDSLMDRHQAEGAFLCDPDTFRFLYKLEGRRVIRSGQAVFLVLLTLTMSDYSLPSNGELKMAMGILEEALLSSLRKGDVICRWNEAQFICILPGLNFEQSRIVLGRIEQSYKGKDSERNVVLRTKVQPLHLWKDYNGPKI